MLYLDLDGPKIDSLDVQAPELAAFREERPNGKSTPSAATPFDKFLESIFL